MSAYGQFNDGYLFLADKNRQMIIFRDVQTM